MPIYKYHARNNAGEFIQGSMMADTKDDLAKLLQRKGYAPTRLRETVSDIDLGVLWEKWRGIRTDDLIVWNFQLSSLISSGINVMSALDVLKRQTESRSLRKVTEDLSRDVDAGDSFSEALAKHPRAFPKLFMSMIHAGEASGKLDTVLGNYAIYCEKQLELRQKVQGALFYPVLLLFAGACVMTYIVMVIIPQFVEIFLEAGVKLPLPTILVYKLSGFAQQFWLTIVLIIAASCTAFVSYSWTKKGRYRLDHIKLHIPIIGTLHRRTVISRFSKVLSTLVGSGVPILESLQITRGVLGNEVMARSLDRARSAVERGERIGESLKVTGEFPPDAVQMMLAGEETGMLDHMLNKMSDLYDHYIGYSIKKLTTVFEPLLLSVMGAMVAFIMLSTLLPMLDMISVLRR